MTRPIYIAAAMALTIGVVALCFASPPRQALVTVAFVQAEAEGFVVVDGFAPWTGHKPYMLTNGPIRWTHEPVRLLFSDDLAYRAVEKAEGFAVKVSGVNVRRGSEYFFVVKDVTVIKSKVAK